MHKLVALALLVACSSKPPTTPAPAQPGTSSHATRTEPTAKPARLLVANKGENTVSVLELPAGTELAKLPTGNGPHEIAVAPDGKRAVISNYGDKGALGQTLTVIDLDAFRVASTIELGEFRRPHGIAFVDQRRVVVTAEVNAAVVVVDVDAGKVERSHSTKQEGSHMLTLSPDRRRVYAANMKSGTITPIDLEAATSGEPMPSTALGEAIAITRDGKQVWSASLSGDKLVVLEAPALTPIAELPALGAPIRITPVPDGSAMLVSNVKASKLQLVDVAKRTMTTIDVPPTNGETAAPIGSVISPDSKTAYVALAIEDRVAVIDLANRAITGHLATGKGPDGIAYVAATP